MSSAQIDSNVSFARLLVTPEKYDGKKLTVSGVLRRGEAGSVALYLDFGSAEHEVTANAVVLLRDEAASKDAFDRQIDEADGKYVLVVAVFDADRPRPRGYSGILKSVELIRTYPLLQALPE